MSVISKHLCVGGGDGGYVSAMLGDCPLTWKTRPKFSHRSMVQMVPHYSFVVVYKCHNDSQGVVFNS